MCRSDAVSAGTFTFVRYSEVYVIAGVAIARSDLYQASILPNISIFCSDFAGNFRSFNSSIFCRKPAGSAWAYRRVFVNCSLYQGVDYRVVQYHSLIPALYNKTTSTTDRTCAPRRYHWLKRGTCDVCLCVCHAEALRSSAALSTRSVRTV